MTTQGERIRELAAAHGMTPAQLARAANIDGSAMVNITNDKTGLGRVRAQRIADALGVDVSDVLLPKAEAVTLASIDHRLQSLEALVREAVGQTRRALELLDDPPADEAQPPRRRAK